MIELIFATNNQHKIEEVQSLLGNEFRIITLANAGIHIDIPEPHDTLEANAMEKATVIHNITHQNCFSEDTGLEVEALQGEPGVRSARYAGEQASAEANIQLLLHKMQHQSNKKARFRTVIALIFNGKNYQFEGICSGSITIQKTGDNGFGYDPIFIPDGSDKTFAEMEMREKNNYSHRKKALQKLIQFLSSQEFFYNTN